MENNINPDEEGDQTKHILASAMLGIAISIFCGMFFAAFFYFRPDRLSLLGRYFPSPTATFTPPPTLTPTASSTPTPNLIATQKVQDITNTAQAFQSTATFVASEWKVVLDDNFDSNKSGWGTESSDTDRAKSSIKVADGKYTWDIATHKLEITWESAHSRSLGDFVLSVDAKQIGGPASAEYGLTFREGSAFHAYYFGINNRGEYFLYLYNDEWITLKDYTQSKLILPNKYNRLAVLAEGSHFTFFINGQYLFEYTDARLKNGNVSLFSLLNKPNQQAIFEFDNFELRAP